MSFFPEFLHYTRNERKGIFALMVLVIVLAIIPRILPFFVGSKTTDFKAFEQQIATIHEKGEVKETEVQRFYFDPNTISKDSLILLGLSPKTAQTILNYRKKVGRFSQKEDLQKIYTLSPEDYQKIENYIDIKKNGSVSEGGNVATLLPTFERFDFDPNTSSKEELLSLGLPQRVVKTLLNFREKGGHFYKEKDLQKIYGLSQTLFAELEPFIQIEPKENKKTGDKKKATKQLNDVDKSVRTEVIIDINKASAEEWQQLSGVGPAYAKRIVNFREKLGGFSSISLVGQTYGIPDSTFQKVKPFLKLSPVLRKIKINTASIDQLKAHPFLKKKEASTIIYYRQNHGNFTNIEDLRKVRALKKSIIDKLAPYLDFDNK